MAKNVLVTGGAGCIGSHTVLQLLLGGFRVVVVDDLDDSSRIDGVKKLAGEHVPNLSFHKLDLRDKSALEKLFSSTKFHAVIHFAGSKAVGESVQKPLLCYDNNLIGTITLLEVMDAHGCKKLVFSSSATVYGRPKVVPCTEDLPVCAMNPYGRTKLFIEEICHDVHRADPEWKIMLLRYFNPVGAHPSGYIVGRRPAFSFFRTDYSTKDGTVVGDYIHVVDLADGHIAALQKLDDPGIGCEVYNLGTGKGTSALEMVTAIGKASGKEIPLCVAGRRPGVFQEIPLVVAWRQPSDAEIVYASTEKAERELNWKAKYGIEEMCRDEWNWASENPGMAMDFGHPRITYR